MEPVTEFNKSRLTNVGHAQKIATGRERLNEIRIDKMEKQMNRMGSTVNWFMVVVVIFLIILFMR